MVKRIFITLIAFTAMVNLTSPDIAQAANGTVKFTFKYKSSTGVETALPSAFVYLHSASKLPPMEKFFSKADYIGSHSYGNGSYLNADVPEGKWYIRITQRAVSGAGPYGPPQTGDYTWFQTTPITVVAGQTLDLGTLYAVPFSTAPITITGKVKNGAGAPVAGYFVRAQSQPCLEDGYNNNLNQCGPDKNIAIKPTDAAGTYTIMLRDPGPYYLYASPCLSADYEPYQGNKCAHFPASANPVAVKINDVKTVDLVVY